MFTTQTDLYGTPLPECKGRWRKVAAYLCRPDILSVAPVLIASCVWGEMSVSGRGLSEMIGNGTVVGMTLSYYIYTDSKIILPLDYNFGERAQTLAIETKPEIIPAPSVAKYGRVAERLRSLYKTRMLMGIVAPALCSPLLYDGASSLSTIVLGLTPATVYLADAYRRWNKVANGDWEIVDRPALKEPVPVLDKVKTALVSPVPASSSNLG